MKKHLALPAGLASLLLLGACTATTPSIDTYPDSNGTSSVAPLTDDTDDTLPAGYDEATESSSSAPTAMEPGVTVGQARIIEMTVTDWEFSQKTIAVTQGENVIVRLTGVEGSHSFTSADLGINQPIAPGETKDIVIPTDKAGTFSFRCAIPCGPGHRDMTGSIVVS